MEEYRQPAGFMVVLVLLLALALGPGSTEMARAASEDVAMFYDDLSQYGQWAEDQKYGPVWRPSQVPEDWRPYTDGRWVPTNDGNVFESQEPWGWATYHYGNWMPTENGWVWVPGSTWYPSTVEWRSSPETEPVDSSYIGWAPTPPPNYEPPPGYAPPSYYQGAPVTDSLSSPLWIFAKAASFLLGLGQPYTPAYSYVTSGILVPPTYVPVFYSRTVFIPRYVTPAYYPPGFIGVRRFGGGAYNMGPSVAYISRVTRINQTVINQSIHNNSIYINRIHNVMPPDRVLRRDGYINKIMPPALIHGQPLPPPHPITNVRMAQANLNKPNFLPPPQGVPRINAQIPRFQPVAVTPGRGLPGTALPARATMPLTPHMTQQIQQLPPNQQFVPGKSQPFKPVAAPQAQPAPGHPGSRPQPGQFQPGPQTRPGPGQAVVPGQPGHAQPGATPPSGYKPPTTPGYVRPGTRPSSQPQPGEFHRGTPSSGTPTAPGTPGATKPGTVPLSQGSRALTPEQRRQQEVEHQRLQRGGTPAQPQQPQQRDQERLRQQQLQQQQRQQQDRQRQLQLQQQQQRQQQMQQQRRQQEHIRQQQIQRQQQRQPQIRQEQRQQQIQQRQQQPQRQPQQQQRQQQRQEKDKKKQEHQQ
jgi:hypothetical protein